jgi:hypothetical protein
MNRLSFLKTIFAAPVAAKVLTEQVKAMPEVVKDPVTPPVVKAPMTRATMVGDSIGVNGGLINCSGYIDNYNCTLTGYTPVSGFYFTKSADPR